MIHVEKILTFGCSHTVGDELKDRNISAWPILLGKKLNLPVINYGREMSSNQEIIYNAIINSSKGKKYLIIILTTSTVRVYWPYTEIFKNILDNTTDDLPDAGKNYASFCLSDRKNDVHDQRDHFNVVKSWMKYHYDQKLVLDYNNFLFQSCKELLESRGHLVYIFNFNEQNYIYNESSFNDIVHHFPRGPRGHYLEEAQEAWANYLYNFIK